MTHCSSLVRGLVWLVGLTSNALYIGCNAPEASMHDSVVINGNSLTGEQILEIESTYGVRPQPGEYWYDQRSGLYGVVGNPAYGFMFTGHDFGPIARNASRGTSGVIVNGRELQTG